MSTEQPSGSNEASVKVEFTSHSLIFLFELHPSDHSTLAEDVDQLTGGFSIAIKMRNAIHAIFKASRVAL